MTKELIPIVRIVFRGMPDLIITQREYYRFGNLLKFCSEYSLDLKEIKRCKSELISPKDFPATVWEG